MTEITTSIDRPQTTEEYAWNAIREYENDLVNHPAHYIKNGIETIDVIDAFTADLKGFKATRTANIIKYILRWPSKEGLQDLKKARWYLNDLIAKLELEEEEEDLDA